ncbi:hypothetical protein ACFFX0_19305 [Citricoccus parietis]|uniref:Uncharacterized protein n=1 Tax=Citricoccus parietis TaxID=592307 RepID=A0ABV5G2R7_9MICC
MAGQDWCSLTRVRSVVLRRVGGREGVLAPAVRPFVVLLVLHLGLRGVGDELVGQVCIGGRHCLRDRDGLGRGGRILLRFTHDVSFLLLPSSACRARLSTGSPRPALSTTSRW